MSKGQVDESLFQAENAEKKPGHFAGYVGTVPTITGPDLTKPNIKGVH
jgi:hypothetical protein